MPTLQKQVWVNQLLKNFYPDTSFITYMKDYSAFVENDILNIPSSGVDPDVLINNTTYPIASYESVDNANAIEVEYFRTKNAIFHYDPTIELSYNKTEAVVSQHRSSLQIQIGKRAAYLVAPASDSASTPILVTTGLTDGTGRLRLTIQDILNLKGKFDDLDYPTDKRYLVLHPKHVEDLILIDVDSFKDVVDLVSGTPKNYLGFKMLQFNKTPYYNITNKTKIPFGSATDANSVISSFAFYTDEVCKADGTVKMMAKIDDPEIDGSMMGFGKRFVAKAIRNRGIAALISGKV